MILSFGRYNPGTEGNSGVAYEKYPGRRNGFRSLLQSDETAHADSRAFRFFAPAVTYDPLP
jgi:hypothetical protein